MKKGGYFLSIVMVVMIGTMAFTTKNVEVQTEWSEWTKTACAKGLDYRVKKGSYDMSRRARKWQIQFKSRYGSKMHFSFKLMSVLRKSDARRMRAFKTRMHLEPNASSKELQSFVKANKEIYVHIDKIRFGKEDKGKNFYPCKK